MASGPEYDIEQNHSLIEVTLDNAQGYAQIEADHDQMRDLKRGMSERARMAVLSVGIAFGGMGGTHAIAQGTPQTAAIMKVDPATLATGYRASKVIGSTVVNDANETVGTVDDLIVTPTATTPFAVLSVGGFLGLGTKYVIVPFTSLQVKDKTHMILPGATKDSLKELPEYRYSS
jgi:hypothetical protein